MSCSSNPICFLAAAILLLMTSAVSAQEQRSPEAVIDTVDKAYRALEYEKAETMAREALSDYQELTVDQLIQLHRLLAIVQISQNERTAARRQFEAALSLDPNLQLDPTFVSPKIIDFYEKVREAYLTASGRTPADSLAVRYRLLHDSRSAAVLRSVILPGWGQMYMGQSRKGWWMMGGWGISLGGALLAHTVRDDALSARQETFGWDRARTGFLVAAAGIWIGSYLDALLTQPDSSTPTLRLSIRPNETFRPAAVVRVTF